MLPRLNQCCDIYRIDIDDRGDRALTPVKTNVKCRFTKNRQEMTDNRGEDTTFDGYLHLNHQNFNLQGFFISIDKLYYEVVKVSSTADLDGKFLFDFLTLKESYAD
jgi:hypothetical protein